MTAASASLKAMAEVVAGPGNDEDSTETHPVAPTATTRQRRKGQARKRDMITRSLITIKNQIAPKKPFDNFYNLGNF
jgi:hypothetical protein